jgi:response regulator of citrate/malate metabolism
MEYGFAEEARRVEQILSRYGIDRETAMDFVDAIVRMNQSEAADEVGVSRPTIRRYKEKFGEMGESERAFLISYLSAEKYSSRLRPDSDAS